jgi:hypothetical protein
MGEHDDPSSTTEPAYGFFGVYHPCDQHPTAQHFPIFDLEEVRRIAAEIRPNTSRFVMKEHAKGARIRNDKEQLPEADQHREMFSWAIQSELIEVLGNDHHRAMALAYVLCAHYSTRAFVIVAPHDPQSPDGNLYPDQIVTMPPLSPKMPPDNASSSPTPG